jgi:hypothetical protein
MNRAKFVLLVATAMSLVAVMALAAPGTSTHKPDHNPAPTTTTSSPASTTSTTPAPTTTSAAPGGGSVGSDFKQCKNNDVAPHGCEWSGSILQQNNAEYSEGMSVPQQLILNGLTGSSHSLSFQSQASKGGKHAYDFITSFAQAETTADLLRPGDGLMANIQACIGLAGQALTRCEALRVSANNVDVAAPDNMGMLEGHNVAAAITNYETAFSNRVLEIYASPGASSISGATLVFVGYTGSGDKEANYILNWTSTSSDIMIRWAGHLSIGPDALLGYGPDTGSSSISGGPYHWGLSGLDGGSVGNQANQIQGSDINAIPASGTITIVKDAIPDSAQDFFFASPSLSPVNFTLDDDTDITRANAQVFSQIAAGTYTITESAVSGWTLSSISCDAVGTGTSASFSLSNRSATIVMGVAGSVTCIFTNNGTAQLTVIKAVTNDSGGTKAPADFSLHVKSGGVDVAGSPHAGNASGFTYLLSPGSYNVSEDAVAGYNGTFSGDCSSSGGVTLAPGAIKNCTITNDDLQPRLTIIKHVVNDDGGARSASEWTMQINATDPSSASFAGSESPGTTITIDAGSYSVNESGPSGYAPSLSADCSGSIALGASKTCTITNDDIAPTLLVKKHVVNDHGGREVAANWTLAVNGTNASPASFAGSEAGVLVTLDAGPYSVNESLLPAGYGMSISGQCSGTLAPGESKNCTITNDDIRPSLLVKKHVINDDGGARDADDWTLWIWGEDVSSPSVVGNESGVRVYLNASAAYSVNETGPSGYTLSLSADCSGILAPGDNKTCTLTNDDQEASLTVIKHVVNDNGGARQASEWTMMVNATDASDDSFDGDEQGVTISLDAGSYSVSESGPAGYANSTVGCSGLLGPGQNATCTFTNDDVKPRLKVIKSVINDNGGSNVSSDWTMLVDGPNASQSSFAGSASGVDITLDAGGMYWINESLLPAGYSASSSSDCSGILAPGDNKTCTITNDDIKPRLTVIKLVVNDHGGHQVAANWTMSVSGTNVSQSSFAGNASGVALTLDAHAAYNVTESLLPAGYNATFSADCAGILEPGANKTCTITNDDIQPRLVVIKHVINDDGGQNVSADWTLFVSGGDATPSSFAGNESGVDVLLDAGGYSVAESSLPGGYNATYSSDCEGSMLPGDVKTCTITNDDIAPRLRVIKHVINDDGGQNTSAQWTMSVLGDNVSIPSFPGDEAGTWVTLDANAAFSVDESSVPGGYAMSLAGDCSGILQPGASKTCTVTNDDIAPTLLVKKHVINDNGGLNVSSQWILSVNGTNVSAPSFAGSEAGVLITLDANSLFSVSESSLPAGYSMSLAGDCSGQLQPGDEKNCTLTNDDIAPTLIVVKHVVNDDGGSNLSAEWTMSVSGVNVSLPSFPGSESGILLSLDANSLYGVTESTTPAGYAMSTSGDCSGILQPGANKTCTVTNDDIAPKLLVKKHVINDNGGLNVSSQWILSVNGTNVSSPSFAGSEAGVLITLDANALFTVSESSEPLGYALSQSGDCSGLLQPGDEKTCTLTNDDIAPTLFVVKHVVNDNGGLNVSGEWTMSVSGVNVSLPSFPGSESGVLVSIDANSLYGVTESATPVGYAMSASAGCSGTMGPGQSRNCTLTNDDIAPRLLVKKIVVNGDGGTNVSADWTMHVNGTAVSNNSFPGSAAGTLVTLNATSYSVNESSLPRGYAANFSADCSGSMHVGDSKVCTVTNDDIRPELTVIKHVINDHGGSLNASSFTMHVSGDGASPSTFAGNESGTLVTMAAGAYSADEDAVYGYAKNRSADCSGAMHVGDKKTCIITNNDIQPRLTVIKHVVNDDGLAKVAADFTMLVTGTNVSSGSFPGAESPGVLLTLNAGNYSVNEVYDAAYAKRVGSGCSGAIGVGDNLTCVITNNDIGPTRTQGFWSEHTVFTKRMFTDYSDGEMTIGSGSHAKLVDTYGELFGAFLSDIKKESDREKRDPLEQARMQLAQQLAAARLNCAAFGCNQETLDMLDDADDAYVGTDAGLIITYVGLVDAYNNSRDSMPISSGLGSPGKSTARDSRSIANIPFWDETLS